MIYLFLSLAGLLAVYADNDRFLYPGTAGVNGDYSQNPPWPLSSTQKVRWITSLSSYNVTLYQQSLSLDAAAAGAAIYAKSPTDSEVGGVDWIVQAYSFDLDVSPVFFLWAQNPTTSFTSHYFNITEAVSASPSSSSVAPSLASMISSAPISTIPSTLSTSISSAPSSSSAAGSATAISSPSPQNNSSATKVGLGVGLGLGIPIVLLLGISVGMRVMKARQPYPAEGPHLLQDNAKFASASPPSSQMEPSTYERPKSAPPVELPAKSDSPRELQ